LSCDNKVEEIGYNIQKRRPSEKGRSGRLFIDHRMLNFDRSLLRIEKINNGLTLSQSQKFKNAFNFNFKRIKSFHRAKSFPTKNIKSNSSYYLLSNYANLGWSMTSADINLDGADDLLIGAPVYSPQNSYQSGAVFVVLSKNGASLPLSNLNLQQAADLIIEAPINAARSRFGHSITILDINLDGIDDVIVSAPSYMLDRMSYEVKIL
jgi:hypothetical protein